MPNIKGNSDTSVNTSNPKTSAIDDSIVNPSSVSGAGQKELEPSRTEEDKLMAEIKSTAEFADKQALEALKETFSDIKRSQPETVLPPDVEDAGVYSPEEKANEVVAKGTTIDLPVSEEKYKVASHAKIVGSVKEKVVVGASSVAALAIWVGRLMKMAHKHTMKLIFRKGERSQ